MIDWTLAQSTADRLTPAGPEMSAAEVSEVVAELRSAAVIAQEPQGRRRRRPAGRAALLRRCRQPLLPDLQPQQEEPHARPEAPGRPGRLPPPGGRRRKLHRRLTGWIECAGWRRRLGIGWHRRFRRHARCWYGCRLGGSGGRGAGAERQNEAPKQEPHTEADHVRPSPVRRGR